MTGAQSAPHIGVLAVQGAFIEHANTLTGLGARVTEIRQRADLVDFDALVLPGGESTAQRRLVHELGLYEPLRERLAAGTPVLATCAGMIMLAREVREGVGSGSTPRQREFAERYPTLQLMPVVVERNAYGRQLGSFHTTAAVEGIGDVSATFIRAPYIVECDDDVRVLSRVEGRIVAARWQNAVALSFHPELTTDAVHAWFLREVVSGASAS